MFNNIYRNGKIFVVKRARIPAPKVVVRTRIFRWSFIYFAFVRTQPPSTLRWRISKSSSVGGLAQFVLFFFFFRRCSRTIFVWKKIELIYVNIAYYRRNMKYRVNDLRRNATRRKIKLLLSSKIYRRRKKKKRSYVTIRKRTMNRTDFHAFDFFFFPTFMTLFGTRHTGGNGRNWVAESPPKFMSFSINILVLTKLALELIEIFARFVGTNEFKTS